MRGEGRHVVVTDTNLFLFTDYLKFVVFLRSVLNEPKKQVAFLILEQRTRFEMLQTLEKVSMCLSV